MTEPNEILKQTRAAFEREPRINLHRFPIRMNWNGGTLTLEGDVEHIVAKKLAVRLAKGIAGVTGVIDRLHVAVAEHCSDGEILDSLMQLLQRTNELKNCTLRIREKGRTWTLHEADSDNRSGEMEFGVTDGVVTLAGHVISLSHKRLASALGWWAPGCRDVLNHLHVVPTERDNDDELTDAVRLVLEIDPLIHAGQVQVKTYLRVVTLEGSVRHAEEKKMAELDAWLLPGVNEVFNHLQVRG